MFESKILNEVLYCVSLLKRDILVLKLFGVTTPLRNATVPVKKRKRCISYLRMKTAPCLTATRESFKKVSNELD